MKRFLAAVLAVVMVLSLCSFQVFAADATGPKTYLKLQEAEDDLKTSTTNVCGTIFSFSGNHNFKDTAEKTFTTHGDTTVTCTRAMKIETGTEIKFTAPGKGTLYLYFCKFASGNTIKINDQAKPLTAEPFAYVTKANESVTVSKGSGNPQLGYIEWVSAGPDISFTDSADEGVQFNIHVGATDPITVPFTVSNFSEDTALQVFAFSNNDKITATVSTTAAGSVNGDYVLTIKPESGISAGDKATIYVGVSKNEPNNEEAAEAMTCVLTITLTVTSESERDEALKDNTLFMPVMGLSDISNLHTNDELIFVLKDPKDGKTKAIGLDDSDWLLNIDVKKDKDGKFVVVDESDETKVALKLHTAFKISSGYASGELTEQTSSSNNYFSPSYLTASSDKPFGKETSVRIYAGLDGVFYLRGNDDNSDNDFLGYVDGAYKGKFNSAEEAEQYRVPVEIYIKAPEKNSIPVYYHDYKNPDMIDATQYVEKGADKKFRPPVPNDVRIGDETYTLFGWTTESTNINGTQNLLRDENYVNLYQFDKTKKQYGLNSEIEEKIQELFSSLILYDRESKNNDSNSTPRANDFVEQVTTGKTKIDLYPVYVLSGKNKEVTVSNTSGTVFITVDNVSTNATAPRWRGSLTVQIFIDGNLSGTAQTMYFFYNSDNTVDIKLELTDEDGNAIDEKNSPFIINAVVAEQSGTSGNSRRGGIEIKSNKLTATEGKLDNVIGGSTVKIYMSTRYRAEFYLNDALVTTGTNIGPVSEARYSTAENRTDFDGNFSGIDSDIEKTFIVAKEEDYNSSTYTGVTNVTPAKFSDKDYFGASGAGDGVTLEHGGRYLFGYIVQTYEHEFTVPSPKEAISGGDQVLLNETSWTMKDGTTREKDAPFSVSDNKGLADDGVFRFYAYTAGDLLVSKAVTGVTGDKTDFTFTLTLTAPSGVTLGEYDYSVSNGKSGKIKSGEKFTLKAGEYITITGIPNGVTYKVTETANPSFTSSPKEHTGIIGSSTPHADFTNTLKTGSLKITKTVTGADGLQVNKKFTFTIKPESVTYTGGTPAVTNATRNSDGSYTVTLDYDSTKSENSVTVTGLPVGTYTVEEKADSLYTASYSTDSVSVSAEADATVTVTNTVKTGSLKVSKKVDYVETIPNKDRPTDTSFHFTVTFTSFPDGVSQFNVKVGSGSQLVTSADGGNKVEFDLEADGNITLTGIPVGVAYEVTESFDDELTRFHYVQTWTNQKGSISEATTEVKCENTYHLLQENTGGLRIIKEVDGETSTEEFTFTITFTKDGKPLEKLDDETTLDNGDYKVTLKAGETEFIPNIPIRTKYRVEEVFATKADEPTDVTVVLTDNETNDQDHHEERYVDGTISREYHIDTLTYTNHYLGNLKISKKVEVLDAGDVFTFTVNLPAGTYDYVGDKTGTISNGDQITLKGGESVTIKGLPAGKNWSVTETGDPNYTANSVTFSGTIETGKTATAAFVNTRKTGSLTVRNVVTGKLGLEEDRSFSFTVTLTGAGARFTGTCGDVAFTNGVGTFTLKNGESKALTGLPANAGYTVQETDANSGGYVTTVPANDTGTVTESGATVTFFNDKPDAGTLTIEKVVKNAPAGDAGKEFTFTITLYHDAAMTQKADEVDGPHGGLNYTDGVATFKLKNGQSVTAHGEVTTAEGRLYYKIEEAPATNYKASSATTDKNGQADGATVTGEFTQASANTTVTFTNTYDGPRQPNGSTEEDDPYTPPPTLNTEDHYAYIIGYGANDVRPDGDITRAEVATILFRLLKDETREKYMATENIFPDVKDSDWFAVAVNTMANMGIVFGDGNGFRPNDPITRAEMAAMASRFFEYSADTAFEGKYSDVKEDDWFAGFVHMVSRVGIMQGNGDGTFSPLDHLTRAQAMAVMNRLLGRKLDQRGFLEGTIAWVDNVDKSAWYYADVVEATNSHDCREVTEDGVTFERWTELTDNRDWTEFEHGIGG